MNESLARKIATRNDFDKTIAETEGAYKKVRYWQGAWGQFAMVADFELFELCFSSWFYCYVLTSTTPVHDLL